jgi:hypothetical protein
MHSERNRFVTLWCMASDHSLSYGTVQQTVKNVLQYCKICSRWLAHVLKDDNKADRMMVSQFPATLCKREKQLCASGHLVRRHGSITSLPLVSKQPCSGNTLAHPRRGIKWHYLLANIGHYLLGLNWCAVGGIRGTWTQNYATCCRAQDRPSEANTLLFILKVWDSHKTQLYCGRMAYVYWFTALTTCFHPFSWVIIRSTRCFIRVPVFSYCFVMYI